MKTLLMMTWRFGAGSACSFATLVGSDFRRLLDASLAHVPKGVRKELGRKALDMQERGEAFDFLKPLRVECGGLWVELAISSCDVVEA